MFKIIKRTLSLANISGMVWINEIRKLSYINIFSGMSMKKCIFDVQLSNGQSSEMMRENNMNYNRFDNWTERVTIINILSLIKVLSNYMGFISLDGAIRSSFNFENPFIINNIL